MTKVIIVGAGLTGCTIGIYLAQMGYEVSIFEKRPDCRVAGEDFGRSINLALMHRGSHTLYELGLLTSVRNLGVPMRGRAIYTLDGESDYQAFGRTPAETLYSIPRNAFNAVLLDRLEQFDNVKIYFDHACEKIDVLQQQIGFHHQQQTVSCTYDFVIGADGVNSVVRQYIETLTQQTFSNEVLDYGYKELQLPPDCANDYYAETLQSWPRKAFMLLGNPNKDRSVTISLFMPLDGEPVSFAAINTPARLDAFFQEQFPRLLPNMPTLQQDYFTNPTGIMRTVKGQQWHYCDQLLLIGDAAHGVVPFFGQGMNSGLEDCRYLANLLQTNSDRETLFQTFNQQRKPNTDAVAKMSLENHYEIRNSVVDPDFKRRRQVEYQLMADFPNQYLSKHFMVMFTDTPYAEAYQRGLQQQALLADVDLNDYTAIRERVREYLNHDRWQKQANSRDFAELV